MMIEELDKHIADIGVPVKTMTGGADTFTVITMPATNGTTYEIGFKRTAGTPWVPESALHVRPHRVPMGQLSSQASPLGGDFQYLSRQFNRVPTPKSFIAHILTVLDTP
jgi:hypothetical protein